jgi:hypothetical protein
MRRLLPRFLPRAHSEAFGWLDKSNWKDVSKDRNLKRVDPMLRDVIQLLNRKGYTTYSSCSGGHASNQRRRHQRHIEGYIAFSHATRAVVELYFLLQGRVEPFQLSTQIGMLDEDNGDDQTVFSEIRWQLHDTKRHRNQYYEDFFKNLKDAVEKLPHADGDAENNRFLRSFFGDGHVGRGLEMIRGQNHRFH